VHKLACFAKELFVDLIFKGKSRLRVLSEMFMTTSTGFPGSGNAAQLLIFNAMETKSVMSIALELIFVHSPFSRTLHDATPSSKQKRWSNDCVVLAFARPNFNATLPCVSNAHNADSSTQDADSSMRSVLPMLHTMTRPRASIRSRVGNVVIPQQIELGGIQSQAVLFLQQICVVTLPKQQCLQLLPSPLMPPMLAEHVGTCQMG
jgi:hypothetical protein